MERDLEQLLSQLDDARKRHKHGWKEAAQAMGISESALVKLRARQHEPTSSTMRKLREYVDSLAEYEPPLTGSELRRVRALLSPQPQDHAATSAAEIPPDLIEMLQEAREHAGDDAVAQALQALLPPPPIRDEARPGEVTHGHVAQPHRRSGPAASPPVAKP